MNAFRKRCIVCMTLFCLILPVLFSCAAREDDFLAWNKAPLSFVGVYEADGVSFRAHFSLNGRDDVTVTLLSPSESAGVVYEKKGTAVTARCGDVAISLSSSPAALILRSYSRALKSISRSLAAVVIRLESQEER